MKSQLLSKQELGGFDSFKREFGLLVEQPAKTLAQLPGFSCRVLLAVTSSESLAQKAEAYERLGAETEVVDQLLHITTFFIQSFTSSGDARGDSPRSLVDDFAELFALEDEAGKRLLDYLTEVKRLAEERVDETLQYLAQARAVLPAVAAVDTALDLRVMFKQRHALGDDTESYHPECTDTIPVAVIGLRFDTDTPSQVFFQADANMLDLLINELRSLRIEMDAARRCFKPAEGREDE